MKTINLDKWLEKKTGIRSPISQAAVDQDQMIKLTKLILYVCQNSSFYSDLYEQLDVRCLKTPADLKRLPLMGPADLRHQGHRMLCQSQREVKRIVTLRSSGTQGEPKRLFFSQSDLELTVDFFAHGMEILTDENDRVMICMPYDKPDGIGDLLARGLERIPVFPLKYGVIRDFAAAAEFALNSQVDCLVGIPVQILRLAVAAPDLRPKTVLLSADYVPRALKARIAKIWHCPVFSHYGLTESGYGGGVECGWQNGYHLRHADLLLEIVDPISGQILPHGRWGEVVLTTLTRTAMPLIRYRTGDISRWINKACACGSPLKRLDKIAGRYANILDWGGNKSISIEQLDEILFSCEDLWDYQADLVEEKQASRLILRLLTNERAKLGAIQTSIEKNLNFDGPIQFEKFDDAESRGTKKRQIIRLKEKN